MNQEQPDLFDQEASVTEEIVMLSGDEFLHIAQKGTGCTVHYYVSIAESEELKAVMYE